MRSGFLFTIITVFSVSCLADTFLVDLNGDGDYMTIQEAIDAATDGDTVLLRDGIYAGSGNRNILIDHKQISLQSENGNSCCVIDCDKLGEGFYIRESNNVRIIGLSIVNGISVKKSMEEDGGGGIETVQSTVTIQSCKFKNCYASNLGGGVYCHGSRGNVTIDDCLFEDCESGYRGGAAATQWSGLHLKDCIIKDCNSYMYGGGVYAYLAWGGFENVSFEHNHSMYGGGVYLARFNTSIRKCHFLNNHAEFNGSGIWARTSKLDISNCLFEGNGWELKATGAIYSEDSEIDLVFSTLSQNRVGFRGLGGTLLIINSIFWENLIEIYPQSMEAVNVLYSDIENGYSGPGNLNKNPEFKRDGYWSDEGQYASGDYRLKRKSPCIDAGLTWSTITVDLLGKPRPYDWDGVDNNFYNIDVDMGCYELQKTPPVAKAGDDQIAFAFIDGYALVNMNGTDSYDPDGDKLEYFWYNEAGDLIATGAEPNVPFEAGQHEVTLIVNDGLEDSEPNSCTVSVIEALQTGAKLTPQLLNRKSKRPHVIGRLKLTGFNPLDLDPNEPMILMPGKVEAGRIESLPDNDKSDSFVLTGFFDNETFMNAIDGGTIEGTIGVRLLTGQWVYGIDTLQVK